MGDFKIVTDFTPKGDQPTAIGELAEGIPAALPLERSGPLRVLSESIAVPESAFFARAKVLMILYKAKVGNVFQKLFTMDTAKSVGKLILLKRLPQCSCEGQKRNEQMSLRGLTAMKRTMAIISFALCISLCKTLTGVTLYIAPPPSGDDANPGTQEKPFATIQMGIDCASDGDTVIVAKGTYLENIVSKGKNIVLRSTDPLEPSVVASTIIDGGQYGSVVKFVGTEDETCVLSGLTIRNGSEKRSSGGGLQGSLTRATIQNNVVTANWGYGGGGLAGCAGTIRNNTITANTALGGGGGGLYHCHGIIRDNTIANNTATSAGGGLYECHGTIVSNLIAGNRTFKGGGLACCCGTIQNNCISANSVHGTGGGGLYGCDGTVQNNTIIANCVTFLGGCAGGLYDCRGVIRNCIIWDNTAAGLASQIDQSSTPLFSCIQGWMGDGIDNIDTDPLFVDATHGDYHLKPGSACINAGANYYWFAWPQRDLDGNCRLVGDRVDIGCYEYGSSPDTDGDLLSDEDELEAETQPNNEDTDGDGLRDGLEVLRGSNPRAATHAGAIHVPSDMTSVQKAICLALDGEVVVVSAGTYPENLHFCTGEVILRSSDPENAHVRASTVLDGRRLGPVVSFTGSESEKYVLSGFTIQNGRACWGAGICGAGWWGAWTQATQATISYNVIKLNQAGGGSGGGKGGGLAYCNGAIRNNVISGNSSTGSTGTLSFGGGLYACGGVIENNSILENWTTGRGGGLSSCDAMIRNNIIAGNVARKTTGGLAFISGYGGGLSSCDGPIRSNIIVGNCAEDAGAGISSCGWHEVDNNTIFGNSAEKTGGGLFDCAVIRNCIIWGNTAPSYPNIAHSRVPTHSCIQDWTGDEGNGQGNFADDPGLLDPGGPDGDPATCDGDDYHLAENSPCIDAGGNQHWVWGAVDLEGNPRVFPGFSRWRVDIGAYEHIPTSYAFIEHIRADSSRAQLIWTSGLGDTFTVWSSTDISIPRALWNDELTTVSHDIFTIWTDPDETSPGKFYSIEMK